MSDLPVGWKLATFGELMAPEPGSLTDGPFGSKLKTAHYVSVGPRVVRLGNIGVGEFLAKDEAYIAPDYYETLLKHRVLPGDLLIAGLADPVGRCCLAPGDIGDAIVKADCFRAKPHPDVTNAYLMHYLNSPQGREALENSSHGLGRLRINLRDLREVPVPVAPKAEQRRIVAKLESLFARPRRAREELSHIPRLIESYTKAILEVAFRGDLTKPFREKNNLPAWETKPLHSLIAEGPTNGYSPRAGDNPSGTLSLKLTATTRGFLDLSERATKRLSDVIPEDSQYWLHDGDILVQRANSLEYVGATAIFRGPPKTYIYPDLMMRLRVKGDVLRRYLWRFLNSPDARSYFKNNATGTAGNMPKINGRTLKALPVPMPSELEMSEVVRRIDTKLAYVESATSEYTKAESFLSRLDQANLAKAFRGELVPQDPNDEPASVLLERIRAERTGEKPIGGARRGRAATGRESPLAETEADPCPC